MGQTHFIPFGPWAPDRSEFNTEGTEQALNVIRTSNGYRPFPGISDAGFAALPAGRPTALFFGKDTLGNARQFAAVYTDSNTTGLYELDVNGSAWTRLGTWDLTSSTRFQDTQFQDDMFITNFSEGLRTMTLGAGVDFVPVPFADEGGGSPGFVKSKFLAIVRDFLVGGFMEDPVQGLHPDRIRWSGINAPHSWSLDGDPQTLSDFQDVPDAGECRGIVGGEYGTLLYEGGIFRMDFVGPPGVFTFNRIENARGCAEAGSVITEGQNTYYLSDDGWAKFDGQTVTPIGAERFDRWFASVSSGQTLETMTARVDPQNKLLLWGFNAGIDATDFNDTALIYDYALDQPSYARFPHSILGNFVSPGYDVEDLNTLTSSVDALPAPLDSSFYKAGASTFGGLSQNSLFTFAGVPDVAQIATSEQRLGGEKRAKIQMVQTAIEGDAQAVTVEVGTRNRLGATVSYGPKQPINPDGLYPQLRDGRYQRVRVNITATDERGWRDATGVFVTAQPTSLR